jgi:hypothetical protein
VAASHWIIDPTDAHTDTMNLVPGHYKCRLEKGGPWSLVHAQVIVERDEAGDVISDVEYKLSIDGNFILDWDARFPNGLTGDKITREEFERLKLDMSWTREQWGTQAGEVADLTTVPPIRLPGM